MNSSSTWFRSAQSAKAINEVTLPAVDVNTNKFSNTTDYEFDAVGNLIRDVHGRQFTFNGDNKQVEVRNSASQVVGEYKYDGLGKRIKKETATEYVVFVYDGLGKLIGEYSADGPPAAPTVNYTATDPLGSPRVLTNKQGEVENSLEQSIGTYWYRVQGSDLGFEPLLTVGPPTQTGGWKILLPFRERVGGHPNPGFHPGLLSSSPSATAEHGQAAAGRLKPGQPECGIRNDECGIWAKEGAQNGDSTFVVHNSSFEVRPYLRAGYCKARPC